MEKAAKTGDGSKLPALTREFQRIAEEEAAAAKTERRYMTSDSTIERLGMLLNETPRGRLVGRDELMGWLEGLERDDRTARHAVAIAARRTATKTSRPSSGISTTTRTSLPIDFMGKTALKGTPSERQLE